MNSNDLAKVIAGVAGIILSLCITYINGFSDWFYKLTQKQKGLFLLGSGAAVSIVMYLLSCVLVWYVLTSCGEGGIKQLIEAFVLFMLGNQGTYLVTPDSPAKARIAKEQRALALNTPLDNDVK